MSFELFYASSVTWIGLDWIWVSIYVIIVDWVGLGHSVDGLIALDLENWTHIQLCGIVRYPCDSTAFLFFHDSSCLL